VTLFTESDPVLNSEAKSGIFGKYQNVMRLHTDTSNAAVVTTIIITLKHGFTPYPIFDGMTDKIVDWCYATLPKVTVLSRMLQSKF
jgi:hypothetical protein